MTEALKLVEEAAKTAAAASVPTVTIPNLLTKMVKGGVPGEDDNTPVEKRQKATYADILVHVIDAAAQKQQPDGRVRGTKVGSMSDELDLRDIFAGAKVDEPMVVPLHLLRILRKFFHEHEFPNRSRDLVALGHHVGKPDE